MLQSINTPGFLPALGFGLNQSGNLRCPTETNDFSHEGCNNYNNQSIKIMAYYLTDLAGSNLTDLLPSIHGGGHGEGGGLVALIDHLLAALTRDNPASWSLLGGIETLGTNLHPLILHFPIAFLFGFILVEIYGLIFSNTGARQWASGLLYLGAIGAVVTVISGLAAAEMVPHGALVHDIMEWHERAGITVATLTVALGIWRRWGGIPGSAMAKALSMAITLLIGTLLFLGADMGGMMVYQHGVAVKGLQSSPEHQHHEHGPDNPPQTNS